MKRENGTYPRYVAVYDELLKDIRSGVYAPGQQLPAENELARRFAVSRNTLRQAIMLLHEDGYVYMRQGKGNFVLDNRKHPAASMTGMSNLLVSLAAEPIERTETSLEIREISLKNQALFGLDASALLVLVKTVCFCREQPVGCALSFIPYTLFQQARVPLNDMEKARSFYESLIGDKAACTQSVLRIVTPREPVTELMAVTAQQRLMMIEELLYDDSGALMLSQKLFFQPAAYEFAFSRRNERSVQP